MGRPRLQIERECRTASSKLHLIAGHQLLLTGDAGGVHEGTVRTILINNREGWPITFGDLDGGMSTANGIVPLRVEYHLTSRVSTKRNLTNAIVLKWLNLIGFRASIVLDNDLHSCEALLASCRFAAFSPR
jgi:hypothetical protein